MKKMTISLIIMTMLLIGCSSSQESVTQTEKDKSTHTVKIEEVEELKTPTSSAVSLLKATTTVKKTSSAKTSSKKLAVKGTKIVNASTQKAVQLKGLSTHGLSWYPQYVNKKTFKSLKNDFKINTIRLAMYTAEYNGYCVSGSSQQKKLKKLIDNGVKYAEELNMYVIIDWHILSDGNPNKYANKAVAFFTEMAKKYKNKSHVIYEICNEPNNTSWSQIKKYANKVIPAIRKYDKDALIIVGTPTWSQDVDQISKLKYNNVLYAMHFYAGTHKQSLRNKLTTAIKKKIPVFVSEFGMCNASGNGSLNKTETKKWLQLLEKNKIGYVAWNISNKNESSAILKSSSKKTSGFKASDYSSSGTWLKNYFSGKKATSTQSSTTKAKTTTKSTKTATTSTQPKITAKLTNQWQENSKAMTQWDISVKNNNKSKSTWTLQLTFNQAIEVSNSWNFKYKLSSNKKVMTITPMSYNKKVSANATLNNLGMILRSQKGLKVVSSSFK